MHESAIVGARLCAGVAIQITPNGRHSATHGKPRGHHHTLAELSEPCKENEDMTHRFPLLTAALAIGLAAAFTPLMARAITIDPGFIECIVECDRSYNRCVADRGLKMGCGREYKACVAACR